ncbi:MAG: phosphoribosylglycinamide formyltransferase, partial [Pseudomonadota bacterium]
ILISGSGSNMATLIDAMRAAGGPAEPVLVISNRADAGGLVKAAARGVATRVIDHRPFGSDRAAFEVDVNQALDDAHVDLIALAGFMRILTPGTIRRWAGRMINVHPSLLPLFKGLNTHQRALDEGVAVHGCTAHVVTEELDSGPIIGQAAVPVQQGDTADTLAARVLVQEHRLYPRALLAYATDPQGALDAPMALFPESA